MSREIRYRDLQGAYVIRSAESRPRSLRAIIEAANDQDRRAFPRVVVTDADRALVRAVRSRMRP